MQSPEGRPLPALTDENRHFWTGGADGVLRFLRCQDCGYYIHPPRPLCRSCLSRNIAVEAVSGRGTVWSFTINYQEWSPGLEVPYDITLVELDEQDDLRLMTSMVDCALDDIQIGMPVEVRFEDHGDVFVPVFAPAARS